MIQFYETLIRLNLAVNRWNVSRLHLTCRQNVDDANVKLEKLKVLHYIDDTAAMSLAVNEILVHLLRGNGEQVVTNFPVI